MPDRPDPSALWPEVPEGCEVVAIEDPEWRLTSDSRMCRMRGGKRFGSVCIRDAVAELDRSHVPGRQNWWAYCLDHMYGRWIEDGKVMHWILREKADSDA